MKYELNGKYYTIDELKKIASSTKDEVTVSTMSNEKILVKYDNGEEKFESLPKDIFDILWQRRNEFKENSQVLVDLFIRAKQNLPSQDFLKEVKSTKNCEVLFDLLQHYGDDKNIFDDIWNRRFELSGEHLRDVYCELAASPFADDLKLKQLLKDIANNPNLKDIGSISNILKAIALNPNISLITYNSILKILKTSNASLKKTVLPSIVYSRHSTLDTVLEGSDSWNTYTKNDGEIVLSGDKNFEILIKKPNITEEMVTKLTEKWGVFPIDFEKISLDLYTSEDFKTSEQKDYTIYILVMNHNKLNKLDIVKFITKCLGDDYLTGFIFSLAIYNEAQERYKQEIENERKR